MKVHPRSRILISLGFAVAIVLMVFSLPKWYQNTFVDSKYCLGSQQKYEASYLGSFDNEPITRILKPDIVYITVGKGKDSRTFTSCSTFSENSKNFTINDVAEGDLIFKKGYSNEFSIIKGGVEYKFLIDRNAPELPNLSNGTD